MQVRPLPRRPRAASRSGRRASRPQSRRAPARSPHPTSWAGLPGTTTARWSRALGESLELGPALFEIRVLALLRLLGHVVEQGGIARELLDAREAVVGRVHRRL